jgi:hypothetical protein
VAGATVSVVPAAGQLDEHAVGVDPAHFAHRLRPGELRHGEEPGLPREEHLRGEAGHERREVLVGEELVEQPLDRLAPGVAPLVLEHSVEDGLRLGDRLPAAKLLPGSVWRHPPDEVGLPLGAPGDRPSGASDSSGHCVVLLPGRAGTVRGGHGTT